MTRPPLTLRLSPADLRLEIPAGTRLQDVLFAQGVEFPCGGRGRCKGCRVKVLRGALNVTAEESNLLTKTELDAGWRLACRHSVTAISGGLAMGNDGLGDTPVAFTPREGLGVAIDLGTTTIAAQLLDLQTGNVLGVRTASTPKPATAATS
jgi:uncharacterized 2Fe-2S/4Fe-4S cluster protein (DUF4445 family)